MQIAYSILTYLTSFAGFLAFILAIQQVTAKNRKMANTVRFLHMLVISYALFGQAIIANYIPIEHPIAGFFYFTAVLLIGPTYLFSISTLLGSRTSLQKKDILHLLPAIIMLLTEIGFQLQGTEFKKDAINKFLTYPFQTAIAPICLIALLHIETYYVKIIRELIPFWNKAEIQAEVRIVTTRVFGSMISALLFIAGLLFNNQFTMLFSGAVSLVNLIGVAVTQENYPEFFFALRKEYRKKRYERSVIAGLNTKAIQNRLDELMNDDKIYKDTELNLQSLAAQLSITPHQLSQFLNERLKVSFRSYVNGYRVGEAKRLLVTNRDMNISMICYEAGFGSYSTFHGAFKEVTGMSPQELRDIEIASKK
ncbi:MAG: helix-turn-helix domain-containing protein [Dehalococcoidia bacterium]|jgi:AraC-like DNA-binding protein